MFAWPEHTTPPPNATNGSETRPEREKWGWAQGDDELLSQLFNAVKIVQGLPDELIQTALENHGIGGLVQRVQGRLGNEDNDLYERAVKCAQSGNLAGVRDLIVGPLEHAAVVIEYLQEEEAKTQQAKIRPIRGQA
jgi:hypothetical protein